jgi:hypothetical protein
MNDDSRKRKRQREHMTKQEDRVESDEEDEVRAMTAHNTLRTRCLICFMGMLGVTYPYIIHVLPYKHFGFFFGSPGHQTQKAPFL